MKREQNLTNTSVRMVHEWLQKNWTRNNVADLAEDFGKTQEQLFYEIFRTEDIRLLEEETGEVRRVMEQVLKVLVVVGNFGYHELKRVVLQARRKYEKCSLKMAMMPSSQVFLLAFVSEAFRALKSRTEIEFVEIEALERSFEEVVNDSLNEVQHG